MSRERVCIHCARAIRWESEHCFECLAKAQSEAPRRERVDVEAIEQRLDDGETYSEIAAAVGCSPGLVSYYAGKFGITRGRGRRKGVRMEAADA